MFGLGTSASDTAAPPVETKKSFEETTSAASPTSATTDNTMVDEAKEDEKQADNDYASAFPTAINDQVTDAVTQSNLAAPVAGPDDAAVDPLAAPSFESEGEDLEQGAVKSVPVIVNNLSGTSDTVEAAADDEAPDQPRPMTWQAKLRPHLQKAGESVRQVQQHTATKTRELSFGTQMAMAAASAKTAHTLSQIGSNPLEADPETEGEGNRHKVKGEDSDGWITKVHKYGIQGVAVITCVAAFLSMIMTVGHLIDFTSLLTLVLAPLVFWQKTQLQELGGMRGQQNELRAKVNRFTSENTKLSSSIDDMEQEVQKLKYVEDELEGIAQKAGGQVDRLVNLVHENGLIQKEIKEILDDEILQQIITAVINTDRDSDYRLNKREVRQLEYRLKNIPGVIFHHDRFQAFVASDEGDLTLADVTNIARNLEDPTIPDDKRIFQYTPKQVLDAKKKAQAEAAA